MLDTIFWVAVGIVIGWHWPQPSWVAPIKSRIQTLIQKK
jgi:hypothetical protein